LTTPASAWGSRRPLRSCMKCPGPCTSVLVSPWFVRPKGFHTLLLVPGLLPCECQIVASQAPGRLFAWHRNRNCAYGDRCGPAPLAARPIDYIPTQYMPSWYRQGDGFVCSTSAADPLATSPRNICPHGIGRPMVSSAARPQLTH